MRFLGKTNFFTNPTLMMMTSLVLKFGTGILILPLILVFFDLNEQTLWFVLSIVNGSILIVDSGFGPTLTRATSYFYGGLKNLDNLNLPTRIDTKPNTEGLGNLISTFNKVYLVIGFFGLFVSYFLSILLSKGISSFFDDKTIIICSILISLKFFISINVVKLSSILQGIQQLAFQKKIESFIEISRIILLSLSIILFSSIKVYFFVELLVSITSFVIFFLLLKKKLIYYNLNSRNRKYFDKKLFKRLWLPTWKFGLMQYGSFASSQSNSIIVAQIPDPLLISSYIFSVKILNMVRQISQAPMNAYMPEIFKLFSMNKFKSIKILSIKKIRFGIIIFLVLSSLILVFGNKVLDLLSFEAQLLDFYLLLILSVATLLELHHSFHAQLYISSNKVPFLIPAIYTGVLIFTFSYYLIGTYGLIAIVLCQLIVQASLNNWYPVFKSFKLFKWNFKNYFKNLIFYGI